MIVTVVNTAPRPRRRAARTAAAACGSWHSPGHLLICHDVPVCVCVYLSLSIYIYIYMHIHTYIYIIYIYIHMHMLIVHICIK